MEKATEAREKNEQGAELEQIKLCVVNTISKGLNGLVDADTLKSELTGLIDETSRNAITSDKTAWIVTTNSGLKYKIKQNGEVTSAEPVETVEFTETETTIKIGKSKALSLSIKGKSGNETEANKIEYSFSVENIAEVLDNGQIKILDDVSPNTTVIVTAIADGVTSSNSCEITAEEEILEIGEPINSDKYGYKVNGYNIQLSEVGCWRLFYQDEENTYIISDNLIGNTSNGEYNPKNYWGTHTGNNISGQGKGLNPLIIDLFTTYSSNSNMKATSWFTDKSEWSKYIDSIQGTNAKATFAIASPTIELYTKSYNAVAALSNTDSINAIEYPIIGTYGYTYLTTPTGIDASTTTHYIYSKGSNANWWLASPKDGRNYYGQYGCLGVTNTRLNFLPADASTYQIRPLVCIPTSEFTGDNPTFTLENT